MSSPFDCIRELSWNIPGELVFKLIFEKLSLNDMQMIIEAERKTNDNRD